jgi:hypothetical protein
MEKNLRKLRWKSISVLSYIRAILLSDINITTLKMFNDQSQGSLRDIMTIISPDTALLRNLDSKALIITGGAHGMGVQVIYHCHLHGTNVVNVDLPSAHQDAEILIESVERVAFTIRPSQLGRLVRNESLILQGDGQIRTGQYCHCKCTDYGESRLFTNTNSRLINAE